jgi:hypothetical protein
MPFDTSSSSALDKLRASAQVPVRADSSAAIDQEQVDLLSQFHEDAKAGEASSKQDAHGQLDAFSKGKGDVEKMNASIDEHNRQRARNQFREDYMRSSQVDSSQDNE